MMPVADSNSQQEPVDYKKKYKALKRKLKLLLYEHECFLEELRKSQRKLLKVSRDKSFLLDRLLQYEKIDDSSSDSEATASSESEADGPKDGSSGKRKKHPQQTPLPLYGGDPTASPLLSTMGYSAMMSPQAMAAMMAQQQAKAAEPPKKKPKLSKKTAKPGTADGTPVGVKGMLPPGSSTNPPPGHMTREELERHLEFKQSTKPQFMSIEKAPNMLPDDIFSNENSNQGSDFGENKDEGDDSDLVIDVPQE